MNNLILAASQPEGYIYTYSAFPNIFNTAFFIVVGIMVVCSVIASIVFKDISYYLALLIGVLGTIVVSLVIGELNQTNLDNKTNKENFKVWVKERYQLDLNEEQIKTLYKSNDEEKPDHYKPLVIDGNKLALTEPDELGAVFIIVTQYKTPENEYQPNNKNKEGESW